jgi:hypothetical protein
LKKEKEDDSKLINLELSNKLKETIRHIAKKDVELQNDLRKQKIEKLIETVLSIIFGYLLLAIPILFIFNGLITLLPIGFTNPLIEASLLIGSIALVGIGIFGYSLLNHGANYYEKITKGGKK